jgi:hypothetical protein
VSRHTGCPVTQGLILHLHSLRDGSQGGTWPRSAKACPSDLNVFSVESDSTNIALINAYANEMSKKSAAKEQPKPLFPPTTQEPYSILSSYLVQGQGPHLVILKSLPKQSLSNRHSQTGTRNVFSQ